jgi:hypothetical protein
VTSEEFEVQVMTALLAGDDPLLEALRQQYAAATVRGREKTARIRHALRRPAGVPPIERKLLHLDDLQLQLAGRHPADLGARAQRTSALARMLRLRRRFPGVAGDRAAWYYGTERSRESRRS